MPLVVSELHEMAERYMRREGSGQTLQPTALVNELYLRLVGRRTVQWQNRAHFFAFAGQTMRRILVDRARHKHAAKRGSGSARISLDEALDLAKEEDLDLIAVDDALEALAQLDPRRARIVELRFFSGLSVEEVAEVLQISESTVKREWSTSKLWLMGELTRE
jgi:RNA polymerase sigma factor (TIGR02999 family)